ncbi:conserved exported hypothetical protein [uncultured Desulfovibrio sp.]|uniref:Lipoprotein n=1 Tax=uncultured Desulfovibrio sp. TaxID=167968 RepID=A0A212IWG9_9BACT|nr:conserved exported hypothetical protein [uncultured Desulfovibrio sp.]
MRHFVSGNNGRLLAGLLLFGLILSLSGCASLAERTGAPPPAPRTPGAIATNNWSYVRADGSHVRQNGQWLHIPAAEAGELLLWIEHAEASCR